MLYASSSLLQVVWYWAHHCCNVTDLVFYNKVWRIHWSVYHHSIKKASQVLRLTANVCNLQLALKLIFYKIVQAITTCKWHYHLHVVIIMCIDYGHLSVIIQPITLWYTKVLKGCGLCCSIQLNLFEDTAVYSTN